MNAPSPRIAVSLYFVVTGFVSTAWIVRIPAAAEKLDLDTASLGSLLLCIGFGSLIAFQFVGRLIQRFASASVASVFGLGFMVALTLLALSPNPWVLAPALLLYGACFGGVDVAMNAQGVAVERLVKRPIMGSLHGSFSLGSLVAAGLSGVIAEAGIGLIPHFLAFSVIGALILVWAHAGQIADEPSGTSDVKPANRFAIPPRALWPLGIMAFCAAIGEGSMADWSALYINDELGGSEGLAAFGFTVFSTTMLIGRFAGDRIIARFGAVRVVTIAGVVSALGLFGGLLPGTTVSAIVGFGVLGIGLSVVIPVVYSAAGSTPGIPSGVGVAAVATIGYTGFLAGPPVLGWIARVTSLQVALLLIAVGLAAIPFFASALRPHPSNTADAT